MTKRAIDTLAQFVARCEHQQIPERIIERAADCSLDAFGSALAGCKADGLTAMQSVMAGQMPGNLTGQKQHSEATVWFDGRIVNPIAAATINSMAATALDVDDGHRMAAGHPGAAVIAAAAATAQVEKASLEEFLTAVVLGYEAAVRVALARNPQHHSSTVSGRWSGVGAAVAAAKLESLPAEIIAQSILIAEQHAPRLSSSMHHGFAGSDVKEGIAWSVHTGLFANELAKVGFRGYPDTFEQNILYDPEKLVADIDDFAAIDGLFFKPYACCRWIHSAIDALREILLEHDLSPDQIEQIEVLTFEKAVNLGNKVAPSSEAEAQFSTPFCLAAIAIGGEEALTPLKPELMENRQVIALAQKVKLTFSQKMQDMFPTKAPASVRVTFCGTTKQNTVIAAFGDPTNPMLRQDLQAKFTSLAKPALQSDQIMRIFSHLGELGDAATTPLDVVLNLLKISD